MKGNDITAKLWFSMYPPIVFCRLCSLCCCMTSVLPPVNQLASFCLLIPAPSELGCIQIRTNITLENFVLKKKNLREFNSQYLSSLSLDYIKCSSSITLNELRYCQVTSTNQMISLDFQNSSTFIFMTCNEVSYSVDMWNKSLCALK